MGSDYQAELTEHVAGSFRRPFRSSHRRAARRMAVDFASPQYPNSSTNHSRSDRREVRWTGNNAQMIGTLPNATASTAFATNDDGSVIVGSRGGRAFVWTSAHGMPSIADLASKAGFDLSRWKLDIALGVSGDGKIIVGTAAYNANGPLGSWAYPYAWYVRLPNLN